MTDVCFIPRDHIEENWYAAEPLIRRALESTPSGNLFSTENVKENLLEDRMQLWYITEGTTVIAAAVTQLVRYPKAKVLDVLFMGGILYDVWDTLFNDTMREYARHHGCKYARGYGRLGWSRKVKHLGITPSIYFDVPIEETEA